MPVKPEGVTLTIIEGNGHTGLRLLGVGEKFALDSLNGAKQEATAAYGGVHVIYLNTQDGIYRIRVEEESGVLERGGTAEQLPPIMISLNVLDSMDAVVGNPLGYGNIVFTPPIEEIIVEIGMDLPKNLTKKPDAPPIALVTRYFTAENIP